MFFSFVLLLVVLVVLCFSSFYLSSDIGYDYFLSVFLVFIFSMLSLVLSSSPLILLVSWDLLGVSSYFLVLFYNNWDSNVGSINVALTNRIGDFFLFFLFSYFFCSSSLLFFSIFSLSWGFVFVYLTGFTKSAQFPFSSWLPNAISAPTPVSALVHSSTLVTAGLVLMLCFCGLLFKTGLSLFLSFFGLFTLFFSSVGAILEQDLNKVVALSTLSQMGFSCLVLGLCLNFFCLFHLLSHAFFKSCLFIQVGYFLYSSFGSQDGRLSPFSYHSPFFLQFQMLLTLFCLCGLFFTSGLVSNDFLLEFLFSSSFPLFFFLFFFVSVFFTFFYCFRLWSGLFSSSGFGLFYFNDSFLFFFLCLPLFFFSLFFMWFSSKNLFFFPCFFSYWGATFLFVFSLLFFLLFSISLFLSSFFLSSSFLVDYFASFVSFLLFNFKPIEHLQNNSVSFLFSFLSLASSRSGGYFLKFNFLFLLLLVLFLFIFLWGFILFSISLLQSVGLAPQHLFYLNYNIWVIKNFADRTFILFSIFFLQNNGFGPLFLFFFLISLFFSSLSFSSYDPIKSCLFLIFSVLSLSSVFSVGSSLWFSYFICLLFLSGVFVLLVYFSSLSVFFYFSLSYLVLIFCFCSSLLFFPAAGLFVSEGVSVFFCGFFFIPFAFILCFYFFFFFFLSFFLNFSGGLRGFISFFIFQIAVLLFQVGPVHFSFDFLRVPCHKSFFFFLFLY